VATTVRELGFTEHVVVSSFNRDTIEAVLAADGALAVGWLLEVSSVGSDSVSKVSQAAERGFAALHPFVLGVTAELVDRAHAAGLAINTWTVNNPGDMRAMVDLDVDVIITDRLEEALVAAREGPEPG
jgi:glycerophosphoryl diester phosphodiesterase